MFQQLCVAVYLLLSEFVADIKGKKIGAPTMCVPLAMPWRPSYLRIRWGRFFRDRPLQQKTGLEAGDTETIHTSVDPS